MTTRRKFLSWLGLGTLAGAAAAMKPAQLWASWRGPGGSCSPPCPSPCLEGVGMAIGLPAPSRKTRVRLGTAVTQDYPPTGGCAIPGDGDFCVWGELGGTDIRITGIEFTDKNGNKLAHQPSFVTNITSILDGDWGYAIGGYSSQTNFYIVITYVNTNTMTPGNTAPFGPYST